MCENEIKEQNVKPKKSFKEYYNENPEFRERHQKRMKEKIKCDCGYSVSRSNMSKHLKTLKHEMNFKKNIKKVYFKHDMMFDLFRAYFNIDEQEEVSDDYDTFEKNDADDDEYLFT